MGLRPIGSAACALLRSRAEHGSATVLASALLPLASNAVLQTGAQFRRAAHHPVTGSLSRNFSDNSVWLPCGRAVTMKSRTSLGANSYVPT